MQRTLTSLFLVVILAAVVPTQAPISSKQGAMREYLKRVTSFGFSGQVLVAEDGKILLDQAYGFADPEKDVVNTPATAFNIASLMKQFTATAILRLETDGKLKTTDAIDRYLQNVPADKASITIHQLLTHTAGLYRGPDGSKNQGREETVARILNQSLAFKPGEQFNYSNNGYHLLAAIVEKVSGTDFRSYVRDRLFYPAGLTSTGFYQDDRWRGANIAKPRNEWMSLPAFTEWNKGWNYGAGSIVSTASDLKKWFDALISNKILPAAETAKLFQPFIPTDEKNISYGYGWFIRKLDNGKTLVYHGGDNTGYHSEFRWYPDDKRLVIILANYEMFEPDGVAVQKRIIASDLVRILNGTPIKEPPPIAEQPHKNIDRYAGDYDLPDGSCFKIWDDAGGLKFGVEGQSAIDALAGYTGETAKKFDSANELTEFVVKNLAENRLDAISTRFSKDDYENYIGFLAKEFTNFRSRFGAPTGYTIQGTSAYPWDTTDYRTYVQLKFERGSTDFYLGWRDGKPNDLTTETGRPFPWILPIRKLATGGFATYELINSRRVDFGFNSSGKTILTLTLSADGKILQAKKR